MKYIKENWKFLLFVILVSSIGGYFTIMYQLEVIDSNIVESGIRKAGSRDMLIIISILQVVLYSIMFGCLGIILSNKIGLWKKFEFNKGIKHAIVISIIGGLLLIFADKLVFGHFNDMLLYAYEDKPTLNYIISAFTYGGVFEEVLCRLFFMSLIVWIISKIRKNKPITSKMIIIGNVISALFFALGHLPSTYIMFGEISLLLIIRSLIMNGTFGLLFGWLYRNYSIHYSMMAHFGCHLISIIMWILFI